MRSFSGRRSAASYPGSSDGLVVDDLVGVIEMSVEPWPSPVETRCFQKGRHGQPLVRLVNREA